ncbi:MAG: DUF6115 domain-containing protein [Lachnospiraceae bacterium]|nr:DUF6115 domain-containing protein [Lachnospiraceae bacterium]
MMVEIFLLICGGIIFILSFIIPVSKEEVSEDARQLAREEIKRLVSEEMQGVKNHVDDTVDEAVEYAMEKTERSLERLSNEKIMAVSDYSDTVLQEIHKNHEEVMFLYDMLNDKHTNLKNTVSKVNQTVKEAEETTREAEAAVNSLKDLTTDKTEPQEAAELIKEGGYVDAHEKPVPDKAASDKNAEADASGKLNRNDEILRLHSQGKSNVAIAKQLGMGVGEVKLVIGLFNNM